MKKLLVLALAMALVLVGGVMATDDTATSTATVTVNEFLSVSLSNVPVQFSSLDPGTTANATGGNGYPATATIGAETNVGSIYIKTKADNANFCTDYDTCAGDTFAVSNMEWSDAAAGSYADYLITDATVCSGLSASGTCDVYHRLSVPVAQAAGSYTSDVTITATTA